MSSQGDSAAPDARQEQPAGVIRRPEPAHTTPTASSTTDGHIPVIEQPESPQRIVILAQLPSDTSAPPTQPPPVESARTDDESLNIPAPDAPPRDRRHPLYIRLRRMLGIEGASEHRKAMMTFATDLSWALVQLITIMTLLILCGTRFRDREDSRLSEWQGCNRPLGIWASIWVIRAFFKTILAVLFLMKHYSDNRGLLSSADPETVGRTQFIDLRTNSTPTAGPTNASSPRASSAQGPAASPTRASQTWTSNAASSFRYRVLRDRLTLLCSVITPVWFLTAHILEYTSMNTCRRTSPHLWWLVFGIICIIYAMILEVVLIGFVVLIVAPIIFLLWNIILICIGRHPLQQRHLPIKNEIAKLPKSVVDRIPLVIYIPPPPDESEEKPEGPSFITPIQYPPQPTKSEKSTRKRFKFLRPSPKPPGPNSGSTDGNSNSEPREYVWEEHWEQGDYPFVRLTGNQATCSICLVDYDAPRRKIVPGSPYTMPIAGSETESTPAAPPSETPAESSSNAAEPEVLTDPKANDSDESPEPLRLLACSHVFHKSCLDPWLLDMSGRCPVCQRPVEVPPAKKSRLRR